MNRRNYRLSSKLSPFIVRMPVVFEQVQMLQRLEARNKSSGWHAKPEEQMRSPSLASFRLETGQSSD